MKKKLVSVIMGVCNGGERFVEAVHSIEQQTHCNWEFIICDDGSTDDTYEKLKSYVADNPKYILLRNDINLGLAATLNRCIEHCHGDFIARMDDDDISYPERFKKQIDFLNTHPDIAFVSSSVDLFDGNCVIGQRLLPEFPTKKDLIWGSPFVHPATMFRTEALKRVGGYRAAKETRRGQDYDLFMRFYGIGLQGANLAEPVFRYTEVERNLKQRTFSSRVGEMKIRYHGYNAMGVLPWAAPFILKPIAAWIFSKLKNKF